MRFEYLGLLKTFSSLYDQNPVWLLPVALFSTNRAPPLCGFSPWRFLLPLSFVFLPAFLRQPALGTSFLCFFLVESIPTSHADMVLSPSFSTFFHDTLSFPPPLSTARLVSGISFLPASMC